MPTNELAPEKRIATTLPDLPDLGHPPVHPEEALNNSDPTPILGHPPQTRLLLDGFDPDEITAEFLLDLHGLADDHGLPLDSISVGHPGSDDR